MSPRRVNGLQGEPSVLEAGGRTRSPGEIPGSPDACLGPQQHHSDSGHRPPPPTEDGV